MKSWFDIMPDGIHGDYQMLDGVAAGTAYFQLKNIKTGEVFNMDPDVTGFGFDRLTESIESDGFIIDGDTRTIEDDGSGIWLELPQHQ